MSYICLSRGTILLEMVLALAIGSAILMVVSSTLAGSQQANLRSSQNQQASLYLQEAEAAVKSLWFNNWTAISLNGTYHPAISDGNWSLPQNEETLGIFKRKIQIEDAFRDINGNISNQGTIDPSVKKITTTVSWNTPRTGTLSQVAYLTRFINNDNWVEDTLTDFSDGVEDATDAAINPGFIQLAETGGGGWTEPRSLGTVDGLRKASGICHSNNYLYLSQDYAFGGVEVFDINDNPILPPSRGTFSVTYKPNDCSVADNYLYLSNNLIIFPSVSIYNIGSNPTNPPFVANLFTIFSTKALTADDNYLFTSIKSSNVVRVYQLSGDHYANPQLLGFFSTPQEITSLALSGNYLYVAQKSISQAIKIYNISVNPANPTDAGTLVLLYQPTGVAVDGNILYVSMEQKRGAMLSLTNPTSPQLFGYFPTERNTADITAFGDYGYVAGSDSQLKVIEVFDLSDSKGISGTYFVYGEYYSSTFDAGKIASFNRISWVGNEPSLTNIMFQVAVNNDDLTWNYVGPDGSVGTYYEEAGAFPLNTAAGRYLRYKIILTGDGFVTPTVDKVAINYSP